MVGQRSQLPRVSAHQQATGDAVRFFHRCRSLSCLAASAITTRAPMLPLLQISSRPLAESLLLPCSSAVRSLGTLSTLLGAPPAAAQESSSIPDRPSLPEQIDQPGCELPSLCGEPKNKLSLHRRGNRRVSYYAKRKELFAYCKFCGQTGQPHEFLAVNQSCTGACLQQPSKPYPKEYRPPV